MSWEAAATGTGTATRTGLSRRKLLARGAGAVCLLVLPRKVLAASEPDTAGDRAAGGALSPAPHAALIEDLNALATVLVPEDVTAGMTPDDVRAWLDDLVERDAQALDKLESAMATIAPAIEQLAGHPARFSGLEADQRHAIVAKLLEGQGTTKPLGVWTKLVALPLTVAFYASPRGYTVVGYSSHTGTSLMGDPLAYSKAGQMPGAPAAHAETGDAAKAGR